MFVQAHSASTQVLAAYYKRQILIDQRGATRSALSAEDVVELDRFVDDINTWNMVHSFG